MKRKPTIKVIRLEQKTITRSELARQAFCNSKKLPLAVNDGGIRKEWVGIGWIEDGKPHGDEVVVIDDEPKLTGRFGIVLPRSRQVILFGRRRLWTKKQDAQFHLRNSRGYTEGQSELHSAYVGELGKDFWPDE
jgi:hypothetical protein